MLEVDHGWRGTGSVLGAFQPAASATYIWTDLRLTTANFITFFEETETWTDPSVERVCTILDNLHVLCVVSTRR
jgi:hypothetical protein